MGQSCNLLPGNTLTPGTTTTHKVSPSRPISGDEGLELGKYHPISLEADSSDEDVSVSDEDERVELV